MARLVLGLDTEMNEAEVAPSPGGDSILLSASTGSINMGVQKGHHCEEVDCKTEKKVLETGWGDGESENNLATRGYFWPEECLVQALKRPLGSALPPGRPLLMSPDLSLGQTWAISGFSALSHRSDS